MKKQNKKRKVRSHLFSNIFAGLMLILTGYLIYNLYVLDVLPLIYFILLAAILGLFALIIFFVHIKSKKHKFTQFLSTLLVAVLFVTTAFGNYIMVKVPDIFDTLTNITNISEQNVSIYVMKDKNIKRLKDIDGSVVGTVQNIDPAGTKEVMKATKERGVKIDTKDYESTMELVQALYDGKVGSIILNASYMDMVLEYPDFMNFNDDTRRVFTLDFKKETGLDTDDANKDKIVPDPFTVLISGYDERGELSDNALNEERRSDANVLLTINPKSGTILMTSIPRDLYLEIGVDGYQGAYDKLTHTGLLGLTGTKQTLENALDIEVDYVARVNFSSMIELVDSLGGIDIEVSEKVAEEAKDNRPEESGADITFIDGPGTYHINGEQALDFSRERYCFSDGDLQRNANQQTVLKAIINKVTKPSTMVRFGKVLDTVSHVAKTNMSSKVMKSLIRFEIVAHPEWKFEKAAVLGYPDMKHAYLLGAEASVVIPDMESMDSVSLKINAVLNGQSSQDVGIIDEEITE